MKTTTFYIYEVPGHKNGCTTEWQKRSQYNFSMYGVWPILIETYNYPDESEYWQIVGDREWELAEKNGYSKGPHYKHAREQRIIGQRIGGSISIIKNATPEGRFKGGKTVGKKNVESGHLAKVRKIAQERITCIYCNKECNRLNYGKWHGDKCKQKQ